ncbi:glycoside hydrolase family 76 protein [Marinilabiliaceae bacterium ANBcel2]|nr:glycoside hydrolase family 76 protein [Marinilabiliaceae bacterium ANBcel2]
MLKLIFCFFICFCFYGCSSDDYSYNDDDKPNNNNDVDSGFSSDAQIVFDSIFEYYWSDKIDFFFGNYPNNKGAVDEADHPQYDEHAYLWGFGGVYSAYSAILMDSLDSDFYYQYDAKLRSALLDYYTPNRDPVGFACFVNSHDHRLYDDAIWVGIDLVDLYSLTNDNWYLNYAEVVWEFIMSGYDDLLGGGIYWEEYPKDSKNTCSNAPAVVLALKLYEETKDESYLEIGIDIYDWLQSNLQDPHDYLYWDNIKLDGRIEEWKFSYNSGQMIQAGVLLYNNTGDESYLTDAKKVAEACYQEFFDHNFTSNFTGEKFPILKDGHIWFNAVMVRGFIELHNVEEHNHYMSAIERSLTHGLRYAVDSNTGLLKSYLSGNEIDNPDERGDVLHQGAFAEMLARIGI